MMDYNAAKTAFEQALENVCLVSFAVSLLALFFLLLKERLLNIVKRELKSLKGFAGIIKLFLLLIATAYAGTKTDTAYNLRSNQSDENDGEIEEPPPVRITGSDIARGFVETHKGTNEVWDFSPPQGAVIYEKWRLRGANVDQFNLAANNDAQWAFPLGTSTFNKIALCSWGVIKPYGCEGEFDVFKANLGIVPEVNWGRVAASFFWHYLTASNSLQLTWQNVLLNREADNPISFQAEFFENGNFIYRYDLSSIGSNLTSRTFHRLNQSDTSLSDNDGDGLSLEDEIFVYNTNPNLADTDGDTISDNDEITLGTSPLAQSVESSAILESLKSTETNEVYLAPCGAASDTFVSWKLFENFAVSEGSCNTNKIWERTFLISRSSPWQQFFISASPTAAAPWRLNAMVLEWETNDGHSGVVTASPLCDSYRLPLPATAEPSTLRLTLRPNAATSFSASSPIYLIAYTPEINITGGRYIRGNSGNEFYVFTKGSQSQISVKVNHTKRPCKAPVGADEIDMSAFTQMGDGFSFDGDTNEGRITASRPGAYQLPNISITSRSMTRNISSGPTIIVLNPYVSWHCEGHGCAYDNLSYESTENKYYVKDPYPLDTKCLRKKWYRDYLGGQNWDNCYLQVSTGIGENNPYVSTEVNDLTGHGSVLVDGVSVWTGFAAHTYESYYCSSRTEELDLGECDSCENDCASGNCDSLEGASLGSLKFRIPLGTPVKGQVSGFVWFATTKPLFINSNTFNVLTHPSSMISQTSHSGVRRIISNDSRGRDLQIENISDGVQITVKDTATEKLEHTWEITNVDGSSRCIRLRKISRLDNVMTDETYVYNNGNWDRIDNISRLRTELYVENDFADYGDGIKRETKVTYDAAGMMLKSVMTEHTRIGEWENAVLRETYREENTGNNVKWTRGEYWDDPSSARHAQLKLITSNASTWRYNDYDTLGRKVLEVQQRGNTETPCVFPYVETNTLFDVQGIENAFVTVYDYVPLEGDSSHADDVGKARSETRYVVCNGKATIIAHTRKRYTRLVCNGYSAIKEEIYRDAGEYSTLDGEEALESACAYSYEITYADAGDSTPLLMRGAVAEALDENGVLTVNTHTLLGNVLSCETRKSYGNVSNVASVANSNSQLSINNIGIDNWQHFHTGNIQQGNNPFLTYTVTEQDATYGNILRRAEYLTANDTLIDNEVSTYDEKNRLRSTTYFDGTYITNAYSCCRLLWRQDREGRKTLRSAKTGEDHLYYAEEDVWIAELGNGEAGTRNGFRVTQHFFDGLGRETNTVVFDGTTPGEAVEASASTGKAYSSTSTEYPYGGSDYSIRTDERGKVTILLTDILDGAIVSTETIFTNDIEFLTTKNCTYHGGGSSMRREWPLGRAALCPPQAIAWTEERRFTDYAPDGKRIDYVITESSDCGVVTNSVSAYDLLGRLISIETSCISTGGSPSSATALTMYAYDGTSPRMLSSTYIAGDVIRTSTFLYDDFGGQVGVLQDGVTTRTDTAYETDSSNIVWRVTTERTFGVGTNACVITRERLTMLSDECRSCIMKNDLSGAWQRLIKIFDNSSGVETETIQSSTGETLSAIRKNGFAIETITSAKRTCNEYDALGRVSFVSHTIKDDALQPYQSFDYAANGDLLATHTYTNSTDIITESYAYDKLGNRTETTDALGNTIFRSFDPFGNIIAEYGATYPVRYTYDTQNRRTSLATTRDGTTWDVTRWAYDASTGLCTSKICADGSVTTYTYTPDGLLLRETRSDGVWKEYAYDEKRKGVGVVSNDGKQDAIIERDEFGRVVSESNIAASSLYSLAVQFGATNQIANIDGVSASFVREFDQNGRLVRFARVGGESAHYVYAAHGSISVVSNNDVTAHYSFTEDLLNAGYGIDIQDGGNFMRENYRDAFCRDNILAVTNRHGGTIRGMTYSYDALQRPVLRNDNEFNYNERGEIVFYRRNAESTENTYLYDGIGNLNLYEIVGVGTNSFSVNNRNQYLAILENSASSASLRETNLKYDSNGNLTKFGDWSYVYDSGNRLVSVSSNNTVVATFAYDTQGRRVKKVAADGTHHYFYDGQLLVYEHITRPDNTVSEIDYVWGNDISGARDSACGIGGLLYLKRNGSIYIPFFDAYGNVLGYTDAQGNVVAEYTYDAFGVLVCKSGAMSDDFAFRFSTKYYDVETDLYYYIYRYYKPNLMRWLSEDPIAEDGGLNLYGFCGNNPVCRYDKDGRAYFAVRGLGPIPTPLKWSDFMSGLRSVMCPFASFSRQERDAIDKAADLNNFEILHEQLFFEDGKIPKSIGWSKSGYLNNESPDRYITTASGYDDCIMREAVLRVNPTHYQLSWLGRKGKCNCQDYAEALRRKYEEIKSERKVKCKCQKE